MNALRTVLLVVAYALLIGAPVAADPVTSGLDPVPKSDDVTQGALQQGAWHLISDPTDEPIEPNPRLLHTAILDPVANRMLVCGGIHFSVAFDEVLQLPLGVAGGWSRVSTFGATPGPRRDHSSIYDPVRHRMLLFGGSRASNSFLNDVWSLSLTSTPTWSAVGTNGTAPSGRFAHTAAYDPVRDRMIVFGGYDGSFLGDVWALSLVTDTWTQLLPSGTAPAPRNAMTAIYDPDGDRLVIFGGWDGSQFRNDVWTLSLAGSPAWTQISTFGTPPSPRRHHAAIYDGSRHRLVIHGGLTASGYQTDAYELSLVGAATWSPLTASGNVPEGRNAHRAVYDPASDRLVMFAGYGNLGYLSDTHALNFGSSNAWSTLPEPQTNPTGRRDQIAVYDSARERMLMFGGFDEDGLLADTWALSLDGVPAWHPVQTSGPTPVPRFAHAGIYDAARDRLVVFGGWDGSSFRNDVWSLELSGTPTWTQLTPAGTPPDGRNAMTALYDESRHRMLVFGGWDGQNYRNDLWALELQGDPVWTKLPEPQGQVPSPRRHYAAVLDPVNDRLVIHGGFDGEFLGDAWEYRLSGLHEGRWSTLRGPRARTDPSARNAHRAVYDPVNRALWFFGGYDGAYRNDAWSLSLEPPRRWSPIEAAAPAPGERLLHTVVYDPVRDQMVVFGGVFFSHLYNDTWAFRRGEGEAARIDLPRVSNPMSARGEAARAEFALHGATPNPVAREMTVSLSLDREGPASLELFSVAGQRVARHDVGALGVGRHTVQLGRSVRLAPGVYVLRLSSQGRSASRTIAVVP